jgi:hypothetical protein
MITDNDIQGQIMYASTNGKHKWTDPPKLKLSTAQQKAFKRSNISSAEYLIMLEFSKLSGLAELDIGDVTKFTNNMLIADDLMKYAHTVSSGLSSGGLVGLKKEKLDQTMNLKDYMITIKNNNRLPIVNNLPTNPNYSSWKNNIPLI